MKKIIALALSLALAGCGASHEHTWSFDFKNHWSDCECGVKIEPAAHNLYQNVCVACGATVLSFGDSGVVQTYDEHGSIMTSAEYSSYGTLIREDRYDWAYDENGSPTSCRVYSDGVLAEETTYQPCVLPGQEVCSKESIYYGEDGSRTVICYDAYSSMVSKTEYGPDGTAALQQTYDNAYDELGNRLRQTCYADGVLTKETLSFLGPDGNLYASSVIFYNTDGSIAADQIYDYEFDGQGKLAYRSRSSGGVIINERFFEPNQQGGVYCAHEIGYRADGTKSEEYINAPSAGGLGRPDRYIEYDEAGNIIEERHYDEQGRLIE